MNEIPHESPPFNETHQEMRHRVRDEAPPGSTLGSETKHTMVQRGRPTAPEEVQPWFAIHEQRTLDRVLDQHVLETGGAPICLADLNNIRYILERYPHINHYRGIPVYVTPYLERQVGHSPHLIPDEVISAIPEFGEPPFDYEDKSPGFEARLKNIEGKAPMSLINTIFLEGIARVLAHGSDKYGPNMWRDDPMPHTAEIDSMLRHLLAFANGEDIDPASGELHLHHIGCRLSFLVERYYTRPDLDDRYKPLGQIGPTDLDRYADLQGTVKSPWFDTDSNVVSEPNCG